MLRWKINLWSNDGSGHLFSEPLLGFVGGDSLEFSEPVSDMLSLGDSLAGSGQDDVEVHAKNTCAHIIFDSEIDMLINTESEVAYKCRFNLSISSHREH